MNKKIKINGKEFEYALRKRKGVRRMRLAIYADGAFVVSAPKWYPVYVINKFLEEKADWIFEKLKHVDFSELKKRKEADNAKYKTAKKSAKKIIEKRVEFLAKRFGFVYGRIAVRNQRTCWGSCSRKGNLNFNYKAADLPQELQDYIIIHELCHLKELNHSPRFWKLVGEIIPDYKNLRKILREFKTINL